MKKIYLIPDRNRLEESYELRMRYDTGWEYNDFYMPQILEDRKKQTEIINQYQKVLNDFSEDTIHGAFLDVTPHSMDPLIQETSECRMRQSMEIAKEMGVRGVVFHTGRIYGFRNEAYLVNWQQKNENVLRKLLAEFPEQEIYMENMFDEAADVLCNLGRSLRDEKRFGICLDYAHATIYGSPAEDWLKEIAGMVKHIHINDNDGKNDLHLGIGDGNTDWKEYTEEMKKYQLNASVLIETTELEKQRKSLEYMTANRIWPLQEENKR